MVKTTAFVNFTTNDVLSIHNVQKDVMHQFYGLQDFQIVENCDLLPGVLRNLPGSKPQNRSIFRDFRIKIMRYYVISALFASHWCDYDVIWGFCAIFYAKMRQNMRCSNQANHISFCNITKKIIFK